MAGTIHIDLSRWWRRVLLIVPLALAIGVAWMGGRWFIGNAIGLKAFDFAGLQAARDFAPEDAQTHFTAALLALPEDENSPLTNYVRAVAAAPNDYRLWTNLASAYEAAGDRVRSEQALRRAVELAPSYAYPRWLLGNLLLRRAISEDDGREELNEAFAELRRASEQDASLQPQVVNLAWRFYDGDAAAVSQVLGGSPSLQNTMIDYLVNRKDARLLDDALRGWLAMNERQANQSNVANDLNNTLNNASGARLRGALYDAHRFRDALAIEKTLTASESEVNRLANGDFENTVETAGKNLFGWQITAPPQTQIQLDPSQHSSGNRSLRIIFSVSNVVVNLNSVAQTIVVEPNANYRLRFAVKTQDVRSASTPLIEVLDAGNVKNNQTSVLIKSDALENGTRDWQTVELDFTTRPTTEAIIVRLNRAACADGLCPIFGRIWYDDFELERTNRI